MKDKYEFAIIDTPPALGLITVNALVAATHLLIPVQSSYFALEGTDDLLETVERIRARPNPELKLLGAVITLHDKRTTLARDVHKAMSEVFGDRVFKTTISQEHPSRGEPGASRVDLHVRPAVERRLRVLQALRGGHRTCLAPAVSACPKPLRMRHDPHFVDQLVRPSGETDRPHDPGRGHRRRIPISRDRRSATWSELTASIREKGVLEPILVRPGRSAFQIIAGERRYRAALEAGLGEVPCIVRETSDAETMELALIENLQRKDLTPFEEARRPASAARQVRLHARDDGREARQEPHVDHRDAVAERDARRRPSASVGWPTFSLSRCFYR